MRQITIGVDGHRRAFLVKDNKIIAEITDDKQLFKIKYRDYISADGNVNRHYIQRGEYIIGWIDNSLSDYNGKDKTKQDILRDLTIAMKELNTAAQGAGN